MEREAEFLDKLRYKTRLVSARHLADELGSPLYHGAMVQTSTAACIRLLLTTRR
jgi:hypothetical protein